MKMDVRGMNIRVLQLRVCFASNTRTKTDVYGMKEHAGTLSHTITEIVSYMHMNKDVHVTNRRLRMPSWEAISNTRDRTCIETRSCISILLTISPLLNDYS
jgi:hypothetical protein